MAKKILLVLTLLSMAIVASCSSDGGQTKDGECKTDRDCWKKSCEEAEKEVGECSWSAYDACAKDKNGDVPERLACQDKKCVNLCKNASSAGDVSTSYEPKFISNLLGYLYLVIYPPKDADGKPITCARVKSDPVASDLIRYWPYEGEDVSWPVQRGGDYIPLPYKKIPAGKNYVVLVRGFCENVSSRPTLKTPPKWEACKEGVEFKAGEKNSIDFLVKGSPDDRCP